MLRSDRNRIGNANTAYLIKSLFVSQNVSIDLVVDGGAWKISGLNMTMSWSDLCFGKSPLHNLWWID